MKVYRFFNTLTNKLLTKTYTLGGIKSALNYRHSWCSNQKYYEVVEYKLKELRRLTVEEAKQLNNNKATSNKYEQLLSMTNEYITVEFTGKEKGVIKYNAEAVGLSGTLIDTFNSLDEAISIMSKY